MKHSMRKFAAALVLCVGLCLPMVLPAGAVRVDAPPTAEWEVSVVGEKWQKWNPEHGFFDWAQVAIHVHQETGLEQNDARPAAAGRAFYSDAKSCPLP